MKSFQIYNKFSSLVAPQGEAKPCFRRERPDIIGEKLRRLSPLFTLSVPTGTSPLPAVTKGGQPLILSHIDQDDAAPIAWYYAAMAKRTDIGRGFAAVMNNPEPGPIVFRMARAEVSSFRLAILRRRVMFCQTGRWGNLPPFFFCGHRAPF